MPPPPPPARRRAPTDLFEDLRGIGSTDEQQQGHAVVRELATQQAHAVDDVENSLGTVDLADEEEHEAVGGQPECRTRGAAVAAGRGLELPEIRSAPDRRVLAALPRAA